MALTRWSKVLLPAAAAAAALWLTHLAAAQPTAPVDRIRSLALSAPVPADPDITRGQLANGLRYYVLANRKPEKRAELRLVVKAGSILEEDDQQGLAHFVEHMAFNGTEHFPKQDIVAFIESLGMRFGADLNAYTSFGKTEIIQNFKPEQLKRFYADWYRPDLMAVVAVGDFDRAAVETLVKNHFST